MCAVFKRTLHLNNFPNENGNSKVNKSVQRQIVCECKSSRPRPRSPKKTHSLATKRIPFLRNIPTRINDSKMCFFFVAFAMCAVQYYGAHVRHVIYICIACTFNFHWCKLFFFSLFFRSFSFALFVFFLFCLTRFCGLSILLEQIIAL